VLRRAIILGLVLSGCLATAAGQLALDADIVGERKWAAGTSRYADQLERLVDTNRLPSSRTLIDAVGKHATCNMLDVARGRGWFRDDAVLRALLADRSLAFGLAMALKPKDNAAGALNVLGAILRALKGRELASPDLAIAMAVVWDARRDSAARAAQLFLHYVRNASRLKGDLTRLPWPLATLVVDVNVGKDEMAWAMERYAGKSSYLALYDGVPYEPHRRAWERGTPYTLDRILLHGGASIDRAYFAASVAKVCGRPCLLLVGTTRVGVPQAWVLELNWRGGRYEWWAQGASREPLGAYVDPQTGAKRSLSEARLLSRGMSLSADRRGAADAYNYAAQVFHGKISVPRVLALLKQAVKSNPYDTRPWLMLSEMMARREAAYEKAGVLYRYLLRSYRSYPHFTRDILHALLPLIPDDAVARRKRLFEATFQVYRETPEVAVELMMELAGYLQRQRYTRAAMATYHAAVRRYREQGHLVEKALASAEGIYRRHEMLPEAIEMYEYVYRAYRDEQTDAMAHGRDAYVYRFAERLARLCREAGDKAKAAQYDTICDQIDRDIESRKRRKPRQPK